jgi:mono/diheme cytochrome c family protein
VKRGLLATLLCGGVTLAQAESQELTARGAELFAVRCAGICHQTPQAARLTPRQWQVVLKTMQQRINQAGLAPLTDEEQRAILQYLATR